MSKFNLFLNSRITHAFTVAVGAVMLFAGCSFIKPNLQSPKLLPDVNFSSVSEQCTTPSNVYDFPPSKLNPAPYRIAKFDVCLGRSNVFIVLWPGELNEINEQFARLLGLHFKESYSFERRVEVSHEEWGPFSSSDGKTWLIVFQLIH